MLGKFLINASNLNPQRLAAKNDRVMGSWKNKIVASEFVEERARCDFDQKELASCLIGDETMSIITDAMDDMEKHPAIASCHEYYEMEPSEK